MDQAMLLLEKLADKLGTTTQYVWDILVHSAWIPAVSFGLAAIIIWIISFILYIASKETNDSELKAGLNLFTVITIVVALIVSGAFVYNLLIYIFDPEYYALHYILKYLKP